VLCLRLFQLQVLHGQQYRESAERMFDKPLKLVPAIRGRIVARGADGDGSVVLVSDEPCFELCVYYPLLKPEADWVRRRARKYLKDGTLPEGADLAQAEAKVRQDVEAFWRQISELTDVDEEKLSATRERIVRWVQRRRAHVLRFHDGAEFDIAEQRMLHPVVQNLDYEDAIRLRMALADKQYVAVRSSTRRRYYRGDLACHLLGRTVAVPGVPVKPYRVPDDDYLPGERRGISGLESAFEKRLRGRRGWIDEAGNEEAPVEDGRDVSLTIDARLQRFAQDRLQKQIELEQFNKYAAGGAAVVLKLAGNEVLAAASVPGYDPSTLGKRYRQLRADYKHLPLLDKAFRGQYPPGSIVKPMVLAAALTAQEITANEAITCVGRLSPESRWFRCWRAGGHGPIAAVRAVAESCDVYFYKLGERLGAGHLCWWYRRVGFGQPSGCGILESPGNVPAGPMGVGDARNLAIGQGDLTVTPVQAANMLASLLRGRYMPVRLVLEADTNKPAARFVGFTERAIELAREGMFEAVNAIGGTAYKQVRTDEVSIAGKTGSAQAAGRPIRWRVKYRQRNATGADRVLTAYTDDLEGFMEQHRDVLGYRTVERWPRLDEQDAMDDFGRKRDLSHAWFVGYAPAEDPKVVVAVLIEYGMHGNTAAGPVARDLILKCLELGYLQ